MSDDTILTIQTPTTVATTPSWLTRVWPHPFGYLKSLANAKTADSASAFVVVLASLTMASSVAYTTWKMNVAAMAVAMTNLMILAGYAWHVQNRTTETTIEGEPCSKP
jgi:hypothetical protein